MTKKLIVFCISLCCLQTVFASEASSAGGSREKQILEARECGAVAHTILAEEISKEAAYPLKSTPGPHNFYTLFTGDAFGAVTGQLSIPVMTESGPVTRTLPVSVPELYGVIRNEQEAGRILSITRWLLSRTYKIHLMPSKEHFVPVLSCLLKTAANDHSFAQLVRYIKAINAPDYLFADIDHDKLDILHQLVLPMIVIYPAPPVCSVYPVRETESNAQLLLRRLVDLLSGFRALTRREVVEKELSCRYFPGWQAADGTRYTELVTPRFNVPYTDLIFYAQADADDKCDPRMRRLWFDPRFNSAVFNQNLLGPTGPSVEEYLLAGSPLGRLTLIEPPSW